MYPQLQFKSPVRTIVCAVSIYYLQCSDAAMKNVVFCKSWDQIKTEEQYSKNKKLLIKKSVISKH